MLYSSLPKVIHGGVTLSINKHVYEKWNNVDFIIIERIFSKKKKKSSTYKMFTCNILDFYKIESMLKL
jgi:hypothetical protein